MLQSVLYAQIRRNWRLLTLFMVFMLVRTWLLHPWWMLYVLVSYHVRLLLTMLFLVIHVLDKSKLSNLHISAVNRRKLVCFIGQFSFIIHNIVVGRERKYFLYAVDKNKISFDEKILVRLSLRDLCQHLSALSSYSNTMHWSFEGWDEYWN